MQLLAMAGWRRLLVTGLCLAAWRALDQIAVPGLNPTVIAVLQTSASSPLQAIAVSTPIASNSLIAMGVGPYVDAVIIMTLVRLISQRVRAVSNAPDGPERLMRWTLGLAIVLALGQSYGYTVLMQNTYPPALPGMDWFARLSVMLAMAAGTVTVVYLAGALDEFGLGFGNGVFLIYALTSVGIEVHRLAEIFATAPSIEALYLTFAIWVAFSISVLAAIVAALLASRRVPPAGEESMSEWEPVELRLLMSGVLRPPLFANAVLFVPVVIANYYVGATPALQRWLTGVWTPYGRNLLTDAAYVILNAGLVVAFAYLVVVVDGSSRPIRPDLVPHVNRLVFIGGSLLAITVVVLPVLEWNATRLVGTGFAMSGLDAALLATIILAIVVGLERSGRRDAGAPLLASPVP
jgi:preprotein translocase subunit SecY